jgi:UDP-N-acetylmuramyl pentapeptide phosphotransferase/UDP-N-acetylglucosamine-1-phosphate transferase
MSTFLLAQLFFISFVWSLVVLPVMGAIVWWMKLQRPNYKNKLIPSGFGFLMVISAVPVYLGMLKLHLWNIETICFMFAITIFGVVGLLDDVFGNNDIKGLRGHFRAMGAGTVTTGTAKAVVGTITGLGLGLWIANGNISLGIVNGLLISLCANAMNILDLRPGRAVSCFWLGLLVLIATGSLLDPLWPNVVPLIGPVILLTFLDRRAKVMIGDAGSNALGAALGLIFIYALSFPVRVVIMALLVLFHLFAEKKSLSEIIEGNPFLRKVDGLLGER